MDVSQGLRMRGTIALLPVTSGEQMKVKSCCVVAADHEAEDRRID